MKSLIDFKKESIEIIDDKIRELVSDIQCFIDTNLMHSFDINFIYTLLEEMKAKEAILTDTDRKEIVTIEDKFNEVIALLKRKVLIKIRYGEVAKWVNSEEKENSRLIFFSAVTSKDYQIMENIDRILPNPEYYNFKYTLYSEYFGSFDSIVERVSEISCESHTHASPEVLIRNLKNSKK